MPYNKVPKASVTFTRTLVALGKFQFRLAEYRPAATSQQLDVRGVPHVCLEVSVAGQR
jgi:hypothetical protein